MKVMMSMTAALLLALPVTSASAQDARTLPPGAGQDRPDATATGGPGAELERGEMGKGRQFGSPAGNALVTPNNAAAVARRDGADGAGLNVQPGMLGTRNGAVADGLRQPASPDYRVVDEPRTRQLNDAGTGATNAKTGVGRPETDDTAQAGESRPPEPEQPFLGGIADAPPGFDPAGDPAPPKTAAGRLLALPPHPNPSQ